MKIKKAVLNAILNQGILPLFYFDDAGTCIEITRTLYKAGIRVLEFTNRGKNAVENIKLLKKIIDKEMPDLFFGAGTIKNISEAETFVNAGAEFIVSPIVNAELSKIASKYKMLCIPGCMTPTEIYQAQKNGAELVKIFPANILGPQYISSISDLFPDLLFFPTGGVEVNQENMEEWFNSGVCAVGLGSKLISKEVLKNKLYDKLYEDTVLALKFDKKAKSN
jgi:2-dehydro-3-deoxyphosphogluconate aldolase/(4S)-4-hydroxy-2-oxoglutarate aldolase